MTESLPGWSLGLHIWFVGWDRVGERTHLPVDLDTDESIDKVQLNKKIYVYLDAHRSIDEVQLNKKIFT